MNTKQNTFFDNILLCKITTYYVPRLVSNVFIVILERDINMKNDDILNDFAKSERKIKLYIYYGIL